MSKLDLFNKSEYVSTTRQSNKLFESSDLHETISGQIDKAIEEDDTLDNLTEKGRRDVSTGLQIVGLGATLAGLGAEVALIGGVVPGLALIGFGGGLVVWGETVIQKGYGETLPKPPFHLINPKDLNLSDSLIDRTSFMENSHYSLDNDSHRDIENFFNDFQQRTENLRESIRGEHRESMGRLSDSEGQRSNLGALSERSISEPSRNRFSGV